MLVRKAIVEDEERLHNYYRKMIDMGSSGTVLCIAFKYFSEELYNKSCKYRGQNSAFSGPDNCEIKK